MYFMGIIEWSDKYNRTYFGCAFTHNPEVVGSSPASATIKNTGFQKKSGVFLTFWSKMKSPKIPMGLAVGLV